MDTPGSTECADNGLQVIRAGLSRTGTTSLRRALEVIYGKPCYFCPDPFNSHREQMQMWSEIAGQVEEGHCIGRDQFEQIIAGYCCTTDYSSVVFYRQLMLAYPEAKVILTTRDPKAWVQSIHMTVFPKGRGWFRQAAVSLVEYFTIGSSVRQCMLRWFQLAIGSTIDVQDDDAMALAFERFNLRVQQDVPSHRLLVYRVQEGWEPLCSFLGVPVPDQPFPNLNNRWEFKGILRSLVDRITIVEGSLKLSAGLLLGFTVFQIINFVSTLTRE